MSSMLLQSIRTFPKIMSMFNFTSRSCHLDVDGYASVGCCVGLVARLLVHITLYYVTILHYITLHYKTRNTFCGTWYLPHNRVHKSMAEVWSNFGYSAITKGQIAYFSLRMRETPIFLLPVKNLTSPSCCPTLISYKTKEFWQFGQT